jgi:predicted dithiol-disulfide oxidoreductase (DUF899 family)
LILREFFEAAPEGWQDVKDDNSAPKWGESRKTRLLLREINKLRKMQEVQAFERAKELQKVRKQYAVQTQGPGL